MTDCHRAIAARMATASSSRPASASAIAGWRSSICPPAGQPMATPDGTAADHLQWRDLQFPRTAPGAGGRGPSLRHHSPIPKSFCRPGEEWGEAAVSRISRPVRLRAVGPAPPEPLSGARPAGRKAALLFRAGRRRLIFGSELKALLVHPRCRRTIDPCAVEDFFALGYIAEPRTIYADVAQGAGRRLHCLPPRRRAPDGAILGSFAQTVAGRASNALAEELHRPPGRAREGADGGGRADRRVPLRRRGFQRHHGADGQGQRPTRSAASPSASRTRLSTKPPMPGRLRSAMARCTGSRPSA